MMIDVFFFFLSSKGETLSAVKTGTCQNHDVEANSRHVKPFPHVSPLFEGKGFVSGHRAVCVLLSGITWTELTRSIVQFHFPCVSAVCVCVRVCVCLRCKVKHFWHSRGWRGMQNTTTHVLSARPVLFVLRNRTSREDFLMDLCVNLLWTDVQWGLS